MRKTKWMKETEAVAWSILFSATAILGIIMSLSAFLIENLFLEGLFFSLVTILELWLAHAWIDRYLYYKRR
jgi:hypothetical protein